MAEQQKKKRKRGGLAGVWDRNKNVIKPLATMAAGMVPGIGAILAPALGAAMGGLDRPGKSGIGLDVGGAVKGGISGYGMGGVGAGLKGGVQGAMGAAQGEKLSGLFTGAKQGMAQYGGRQAGMGKAPTTASEALPGQLSAPSSVSMGGQQLGAMNPPMGATSAAGGAATTAASNTPSPGMFGKLTSFGRENASWLGPAATSFADYTAAQQTANVGQERNELDRLKFERERQQQEALAALLMPLFQSQAGRIGRMG